MSPKKVKGVASLSRQRDEEVSSLWKAFNDFLTSTQIVCSRQTMKWYNWNTNSFYDWLVAKGVTKPEEVDGRIVRVFLAELVEKNLKDTTVNAQARVIRTMLRFFDEMDYIPSPVTFQMPPLAQRRQRALSEEEVEKLLEACDLLEPGEILRDKVIISLMVDRGSGEKKLCGSTGATWIWSRDELSCGLARAINPEPR